MRYVCSSTTRTKTKANSQQPELSYFTDGLLSIFHGRLLTSHGQVIRNRNFGPSTPAKG
jgi:hypothetical protein